MQITSKLQKYTTKDLYDPSTGEIVTARQTIKQEGDFNFHKIWLGNFAETTKVIGSKQFTLLLWLISSAQKGTNRIGMTQKEISQKCGISLRTVSATISELKKSGFLYLTEKYILINPNVIFRGAYDKRLSVIAEWNTLTQKMDKEQEEKAND